jgi:hypothetical protein
MFAHESYPDYDSYTVGGCEGRTVLGCVAVGVVLYGLRVYTVYALPVLAGSRMGKCALEWISVNNGTCSSHPRNPAPPPQLYEQGEPDAEASKEGAQPTVNDRASTDLVVQFAQQLKVMRPS